jgi:hypothetical protein
MLAPDAEDEFRMGHPAFAENDSPPLDRRERRPVKLGASATRGNGSIVEMTIVDLSYDGCGVICAEGLIEGEEIEVSVARRGIATAKVCWVDGANAGLSFAIDTVDKDPTSQPRRHERVSVAGEVTMRRAGKLNFRVHIFDLSPDGCKAEFVERPELGEQLWIKFDGIEALEASARWIASSKMGLKFTRSLHPAVFDLLAARLR